MGSKSSLTSEPCRC